MGKQSAEQMHDINASRFVAGGINMIEQHAAYEIVRSKGWLPRTPASFQRAVLDRCQLEQFRAGTPVYSIGDKPSGMFGIVAGCLGVSVARGKQLHYTAHFARPGSWFGEVSTFTRQPQRVALIATRDTEILHLPLPAIDEIVRRDPAAWRFFGLVTIDHLDHAIGASDDLMIRDHVKRFVAILLRLGNCRLASPRDGQPIEIDISHGDLAHMANVARTTAGAVLREMEAEGQLALSYRKITVLAPNALRSKLLE
jgi:CRP/FNR family cyclic AMP-dependent transcriptional regulator